MGANRQTRERACDSFTLMNSALGPLNRRLGNVPNRRFKWPKKTPAARPALLNTGDKKDFRPCDKAGLPERFPDAGTELLPAERAAELASFNTVMQIAEGVFPCTRLLRAMVIDVRFVGLCMRAKRFRSLNCLMLL